MILLAHYVFYCGRLVDLCIIYSFCEQFTANRASRQLSEANMLLIKHSKLLFSFVYFY